MLELKNISKTYGAKTALSDVSVAFPEKGLAIVCGESGCGKTTLLNIASGADIPSSGSVFFNGRKITEADIEEYRRGYVSNIYQDFMLAEELSAGDNLRLAAQAVGKDPTSDEIAALLEKAGLNAGFSDKKVSTMSGGEKQRVAVARALIKDGASVFADEPTGNLDRKNGELIMALLKKIAEERLVVVVSHNERLNREYGQYFIELEDGCVVRSDLPEAEPSRAIREPGPKIRPKLSARTVAVLAATGYRKNKLKSVFAEISGESFSTVLLHRFEVQNAFSVSGVYDRLNESRYIIFLPCFIAFAIGLFSVGFAFFGFLLSSKDDLYAVLRAVGFDAGSVFAVMLAQLSLLCVIGVAAGLATAYTVTHLFGIYLTSNALITEVVLPLGWHAVLISTAVALLSAIATAFFKARKMFSGTIASNKSE